MHGTIGRPDTREQSCQTSLVEQDNAIALQPNCRGLVEKRDAGRLQWRLVQTEEGQLEVGYDPTIGRASPAAVGPSDNAEWYT